MSILSELKQQKHSLDDLAKLPQSLIMQMAQRKQIMPEMVAPILSRKAEMIEAVAKTKALQTAPDAMAQPTVLESLMARNVQPPQAQPMPQPVAQAPQAQPMARSPQSSVDLAGLGQMQPQFAGGGVVAFAEGDYVDGETTDPEEDEFARHQAYLNRIISTYGADESAMPMGMRAAQSAEPVAKPTGKKTSDVMIALASPTSRTYEIEKNSVAEKRSQDSRPEVKEVTKEKVAVSEPVKAKSALKAAPHPYAGMVAEDAKKYGIDPSISLRLLNNETGGVKNPETAVSSAGAVGIAQFMPGTAKQYKIDPTDPKQASDAMNKHVKHLMRQYGDPQVVAIAYNWGEGNTNRWLKNGADPRRLPKETQNYLDKFMRTALAQGGEVKGYAEGGEVNAQSYSEKMKKVFGYEPFHGPTMQKYMSGGEVKHFQTGDFVSGDPMSMGGSEIMDVEKKPFGLSDLGKWFLKQTGNPDWKIEEANRKALEEDIKNKAAKPAQPLNPQITTTKAPLVTATPEQREASKTQLERAQELEPPPAMSRPTQESLADVSEALNATPEEPFPPVDVGGLPTDDYAELMKEIRDAKTASAKQRKEDKAYAMIMAGLATMGGESPNALTNIAKGQATGLGMLQENRKQAAAEDAKLLQMQGTVLRYKDAALLAKEAQNQTFEYKNTLNDLKRQQLKQDKDAKDAERERKTEADLEKKRAGLERSFAKLKELHFEMPMLQYKELMSQAGKAVLDTDREKIEAKANQILVDAQKSFQNNPIARDYEKLLYPEIDFDAVRSKQSAPPPIIDTTGFKRVN
jgi:soluble lytic murein transglycosylase-like protein